MSETTPPPLPVGTADPLDRIASEPLRLAARQVLASLPVDDGGADPAEQAGRLASLARRVEAARGAGPGPADHPRAGAADERLLDLLMEAEVAQHYRHGGAPPHPELLGVLRSYGEARGSLGRAGGHAPPSPFEDPTVVMGLAHDLRSPLTSVLFLSDALRSGYSGPLNDTQRRQLGIVYSAALGLVSMANDILDLYRRGDQLVDEHPTTFSLSEIAGSIRDIVLPIAEERRIDLRFSLAGEDRRRGHPVALARVLLNLTVNGLKYTETGFVEVAARPAGGSRMELSVRDTGSGIRPEEEEMLYQPVRRVSRWNGPGFSGTGLGLALARHLVREMGSDLAYETAAGAGTRFFFELDLPSAPPG